MLHPLNRPLLYQRRKTQRGLSAATKLNIGISNIEPGVMKDERKTAAAEIVGFAYVVGRQSKLSQANLYHNRRHLDT